ncbi:MAG TPA: glycosyltransferase [Pseudanabaena sp.]|nr:glycosyltransferase [Pseudanabaena sp.]
MTKSQHIHLWIPELFATKGGIQVFSGFLLQALQSLYPDSSFSIFLKNDAWEDIQPRVTPDSSYLQTKIYGAGTIPLPLRTLFFSWQLLSKAIAQKPDLIITAHLNFAPIAFILKKIIGTRYIVIAHGIEAWNIQNPLLKKSLQNADLILAVSNFTRDQLCQQQVISPEKVGVLHNTFDPHVWEIRDKPTHLLQKYGLSPRQKIILTVSRLVTSEKYKGYDQILSALPILRQSIPDIHYMIVGKGSDRDRLLQIIQQNNLQKYVTLAGFIPDEDLCDYYNLCDLFAMPSKREGFGIVYLEALACGKAVLGGNLDGAVDALCQGEIGALINPDNLQEIATIITKILSCKYEHPLMYQPQRLRQVVISKFGFEHFQQNLSNYLSSFLN